VRISQVGGRHAERGTKRVERQRERDGQSGEGRNWLAEEERRRQADGYCIGVLRVELNIWRARLVFREREDPRV
jgi:hypothetical protein